ncbi:MAG: argininosuccinate synthase [Sphaerochaetaceae bacterium]|jgi:argininosuccinate synthase|nr:argininosuccinate synthase [Sphaerochaetaceae bacterium]HHU87897.1 argininosuccinate synthase [Spirochaetales bacterium]
MNKEKVVLAYSGGLDTSVMLKWLANKGFEVIAYVADVGQDEDFKEVEKKAYASGASKVYVEDLRREFVEEYIFHALKANALYEGRYFLGTSIARPLIAKRQIEIAQKEGTLYVAHGATGKGNDQVRFELAFYALMPEVKIIAPWKEREWLDEFEGRSDLIAYAEKYNIPIKASLKKPYSEDENLLHISHEAGILEDPALPCPKEVFSHTLSPQEANDYETVLAIDFVDGIPTKVVNENDGTLHSDPLELFIYLNQVGHDNAIGRVDMVENRYVGIKSRGVYETPGGTILWHAHRDLEGICMDKEVMHLRDMLMPKFAELIYNGYWFSPEFDFLSAAINKSQELITGTAKVILYKGNIISGGVVSPYSLYNEALGSMEVAGGYQSEDCKGFININGIRLQAHHYWLKAKELDSTP